MAQFASEPRLQRMGLSNYWGYNPVAMFALHPAYACSPETALHEFRDAIKALHKAGIEVILDIVSTIVRNWTSTARYSRCVGSTTVAIIG